MWQGKNGSKGGGNEKKCFPTCLVFFMSYSITIPFFQSEFCEIKKKYDAARERLENDVKDITELIQVKNLKSNCL